MLFVVAYIVVAVITIAFHRPLPTNMREIIALHSLQCSACLPGHEALQELQCEQLNSLLTVLVVMLQSGHARLFRGFLFVYELFRLNKK